MSTPRPVLVVDFGAQYAQLIARRVREANVYSEIVPHTLPVAEMLARRPSAIVLSGGPSSVYAEGAPGIDDQLFEAGVPVFGMCYGFQLMAQGMGGEVSATGAREYGRTRVSVTDAGTLLDGLPAAHTVWMSHGDSVTGAPAGVPDGDDAAHPATPSTSSSHPSVLRVCDPIGPPGGETPEAGRRVLGKLR